ncbi:7-carboxy-7-deazaguanine synthase QueE [Pelodictyon luteolum]|uniref:7-carboxy-7-deazaguanine synthase n=1 Tax=Chlorobium luteolum (strain DSM 273 / BCRC 81028 / 2530) TaxID=319225 RepID=Q3B5R3_CHLL3|nr:7-carboxy-7-deazaguanine synthase QueE [Pelodictyon luteolum]ABB23318.1 radical activating enzyme, putative [Pelodictyon luteolum DSM 273]
MTGTILQISEIFHSIQGESSFAGWPCTFIRLAGCSHGCRYCDTTYAKTAERRLSIGDTIDEARRYHAHLIEVTGGEPLEQPAVHKLLHALCDGGGGVMLETGGFLSVRDVDPRVHKVIDLKPPSSGRDKENCMENIDIALNAGEGERKRYEFKIVAADREDYLWARGILKDTRLAEACTVMMGPIAGTIHPSELAGWILEDRLHVRMQLQLHRYIWPGMDRGV